MNITSLPILAAGLCTLITGVILYQLFPLDFTINRDARDAAVAQSCLWRTSHALACLAGAPGAVASPDAPHPRR
jgi:hypothetical protein